MKNLGFGMMRLPVLSGPTDFDYDQLNQMVDAFLAAGYTYFDTSFVYHDGKSEEATRKALVERYPRNSFTVATKFPTFMMIPEDISLNMQKSGRKTGRSVIWVSRSIPPQSCWTAS